MTKNIFVYDWQVLQQLITAGHKYSKKNSLDDWEYLQQSYIFVHLEAITYLLLQKELPTYTPLKSSLLLEMAIYSDKSNSDNVRN